jgi:hypothetical protein
MARDHFTPCHDEAACIQLHHVIFGLFCSPALTSSYLCIEGTICVAFEQLSDVSLNGVYVFFCLVYCASVHFRGSCPILGTLLPCACSLGFMTLLHPASAKCNVRLNYMFNRSHLAYSGSRICSHATSAAGKLISFSFALLSIAIFIHRAEAAMTCLCRLF